MFTMGSDTISDGASNEDRPTESSDLVSPVRRRHLAIVTLAVTAALTLGGCGTGFGAQTGQPYQAAAGADHRGSIDVLNTLLVANDDGSATLSAAVINKTGSQQALSSVKVTTMDDKELTVRSTKMLLPLPEDRLATVGAAADAGGFVVTEGATAGDYVKVTVSFTDATAITVQAPVVTRTDMYDEVPTGVTDGSADDEATTS